MKYHVPSCLLIALVVAGARVAEARPQGGPNASTGHLISFRPAVWVPEIDGAVSLENVFGLATDLDLGRDLDVDDESTEFSGELNLRLGSHDLWISGFSFSASGRTTISQGIVFGDLSAVVSETITTDIDLETFRVQYGFALLDLGSAGPRLSITVAANFYNLEASLESATTGLRDAIDEDIPFPSVGAHLEIGFADFLFSADVTALFVAISDIEGSFIDASAALSWSPMPNVSIFGGYRAIQIEADASDFNFDPTLQGPFAGVEIRF